MKKLYIVLLLFIISAYSAAYAASSNIKNKEPLAAVELLVDFSGSMSPYLQISQKALFEILPKLKNTQKAMRVFGQAQEHSKISTNSNCTVNMTISKNILEYTPEYAELKRKMANINCSSKLSNISECRKLKLAEQDLCNKGLCYVTKPKTEQITMKCNEDCVNTQLLVPFSKNNSNSIITSFKKMRIGNATPIELALKKAVQDIKAIKGRKKIIMITDGVDTCGGKPCEYIKQVKDIQIDIITIGHNDSLKCLTDTTGGKYYTVEENSLIDALEETFEVPKGTADKARGYKFLDL